MAALHLHTGIESAAGESRTALTAAMHAVDQRLEHWQSKPQAWQELLQHVFGRSAPVAFNGIGVEILDGHTMGGLRGAYNHADIKGEERIYLNAEWLASAKAAAVEAVLLEELGHAIDSRLNGSNDTAGDEGAIFSALIRGVAIPFIETNQNDHHTLIIKGQSIAVEAAAPTLTVSASPQFSAITINSGVPSGAVGTLVSALIDSGGSLNNFSDSDGDSPAIAIIGTNLNGGTLYYSTNNGTSWSDVGAVSASSARVLYANNNTRLAFTPVTNFSGTISDLITFKAWDRNGAANGAGSIANARSLTGTYNTSGNAKGVAISADGNTAFVADRTSGLQIIDISNPGSPSLKSTYNTSDMAYDIVLSPDGNIAYVADYGDGLDIINVSDLNSPSLKGSYNTSGYAVGITLSADGNTAFIADRSAGLQIINVSDPSNPIRRSVYNTSGQAYGVALSTDGNTAFVGDGSHGLDIINVSDLGNPSLRGNYNTSGSARDIVISADGNTAFVADDDGGLQIVNISNLNSPTLRGSFDTPSDASGISLSADGDTVYLADKDNGLHVIDVIGLTSPSLINTFNTSGDAIDVALSSDGVTAYVADDSSGLQIINLGNNEHVSTASDTASIEISGPILTSATYNPATGALAVTGADLTANSGADNDIDVSKLTITGEGSNTYTLTTGDVELTSATAFFITLNAADQLQLAGLLNKNGTSSGGGTTYNIAAALNWNPGASSSPADSAGNAITVSNVAAPSLSSATYNDSTGVLTLSGSNLPAYPGASNDIDVSKLTITGGSGSTYTLTTGDVELTSATAASITLNSTDQTNLDSLFNQNGTASTQGTTYNIAAADDWAPGADSSTDIADITGNAITVIALKPTISVAINDGGDGRLNASEASSVAISGTTSGAVDGQTVSINISSSGGGTPINTTASVNTNVYSLSNLDLSSLNDGTLSITADVSDLAGNAATQATDTTSKDTAAPTISVAINDGGDGRLNASEASSVAISGTTSGAVDGQTVSINI
ncbi:hypothetical protein FZX09_11315, partial [Synechococcus sp. MU1643]|uniref:hypothetical protein n=1 Tax=Synechococcus sp. MU1643 TaxID=2508349 RepID=UPI001CF91CAD